MNMSELKREDVKIVDDNPEAVLSAMIADYETRTGKTLQPAHIERLLINTFGYREILARQEINEAYRQQHPRFATGLMLDICGDDVGTPRLSAQPATTVLRFSCNSIVGNKKVIIPIGTRVCVGDLGFLTTTSATLLANRTSVDLPAQCEQVGLIGNGWSIGQINMLDTQLHDTVQVSAVNVTVPAGGLLVEDDDAYRQRILLAFEAFSVAGSRQAYEYFTRRVSQDIVGVHIDNMLDNLGQKIGGTVAVTIMTSDGLPSQTLLDKVREQLSDETIRPLCDTVVVRAPEVVPYKIAARLVLFKGVDVKAVLAAANEAWVRYETERYTALGKDVVPMDIQAALKLDGVYNVILSNEHGEIKDSDVIVVQPHQWARCTSFSVSIDMEQQDG